LISCAAVLLRNCQGRLGVPAYVTAHDHLRASARHPTRITVTAAALVPLITLTGCGGDVPPPRPSSSAPAVTSCMNVAEDLVTDVDADGRPDRISDPSGSGKELSISFGTKSGYGSPVGIRHLVGGAGKHQADVAGAVADFNRDGWPDLVVVAVGPFDGDDPVRPRVAEIRLGPFSAAGRGQHTTHLDLGDTRTLRVADLNHDRFPDLANVTYTGDGTYALEGRLGSPTGGIASRPYRASQTDDPSLDNLPAPGLDAFYPHCAEGIG
jgi:hypothetical protein